MLCILLCSLMVLMSGRSIVAENEEYQLIHLKDGSFIASFDKFEDAYASMKKTEYAGVSYQGKLIAMDHGVAVLNHDNCEVNVSTVHHLTDETGYVNGCYGNDALYLRTNAAGTWVLIQMAGAQMWVRTRDVTLVPYSDELQLSTYFVSEGRLFHQVKTRWSSDVYDTLIDLGQAPESLKENEFYFSYDGHFFYTDFAGMHQDVLSNETNDAQNAENPYYNYFMMLPHRSVSNHRLSDATSFLNQQMINKTPSHYLDENKDSINDVLSVSQFSGAMDSFFYAQAEFGSNALLMMALAMNESAAGNSSLAYRRNNLFGHAAYDSDVEGNAKRYLSVENSVVSHARNYISLAYANPEKFMYHGSFFGNKNSGLGVSYASDPYWSEKAAQYAYQLDEMMGGKDKDAYALAIIENEDSIVIYDEQKNSISTLETIPLMSMIVLDEMEKYYRVQLDENRYELNDQNGSYDFNRNTALIRKEIVDELLNPEKITEYNVHDIVFYSREGVFNDGKDMKVLQFKEGLEPVCEAPVAESAVFDHWQKISEMAYEAVYRKVQSIEMHTLPDQVVELNVPLSLSDGSIRVVYEDGESEIIPLTTSMVSGFDLSNASDQMVTVSYGGAYTSYPLHVSQHLDDVRSEIFEKMDSLIQQDRVDVTMLHSLKELMQKEFTPVLTMKQIVQLDQLYKENVNQEFATMIKDNQFSLQVSGLYLSLNQEKTNRLFGDVVEMNIRQSRVDEQLRKTAMAQGWTIEQELKIDVLWNGQNAEVDGPLIFSILRPDSPKKRYAVMSIVEDEVMLCHTSATQSRLRFKASSSNQYIVVSKDSVNDITTPDTVEVLSAAENNPIPQILFKVFWGGCFIAGGAILVVCAFLWKSKRSL